LVTKRGRGGGGKQEKGKVQVYAKLGGVCWLRKEPGREGKDWLEKRRGKRGLLGG